MSHQRISQAGFLEAARAQYATVAPAARPAGRQRIVATVRQPVVEAERRATADDLCLRHRYQRRLDAEAAALDASLRRERRGPLEGLDELGTAIGVTRIVERIDADEDVVRAQHFGPRQRE